MMGHGEYESIEAKEAKPEKAAMHIVAILVVTAAISVIGGYFI
jgi:hypothetical protein